MAITHPFDQPGDIEEMHLFLEEEGHGLLVGGVHHRWHGAARAAGGVGQLHAGVFAGVWLAEVELAHFGEIQAAPRGFQPLRPAHAIEDRQLHVGPSQLGQHRRVGQLHHRMDDRLGVDHDLDVVVIQAEEVVGFDHFEPLVHQAGAIHRDLFAHAPVGMAGGIGHGGLHEIRRVPIAEGAARGGELDAAQPRGGNARGEAGGVGPGRALQALEDGRVFGIGWQQARTTLGQFRQHHRASGDQGFLVGQGQILAGAHRSQGGQQAGATDDPGHHQIGAGPGRRHADAVGAAQDFGQLGRALAGLEGVEPGLQAGHQLGIGQGHHLGGVALNLLNQEVEVAPCREGHHLEAIGEILHDLEGLGADRTGGSQHADGFHGWGPCRFRRSSFPSPLPAGLALWIWNPAFCT